MVMGDLKGIKREATTVKLRPDLWKRAKIEAIVQGVTVSALVEQAIEEWIKKHGKKGEP